MAEDYSRRTGDRKDGRRLRTIQPVSRLTPYLLSGRQDASNLLTDRFEVTAADRWIEDRRANGYPDMSLTHLFLAAYVQTVARKPGLNRFVAGRRIYARDSIDAVLPIRRASASGGESMVKLRLTHGDTVYDIYRRLSSLTERLRAGDTPNDLESLAKGLSSFPGFLIRPLIGFWRFLDYFGWLGRDILEASPYHASIVFCDRSDSGMPPSFRHLTNRGTTPLSMTIGGRREVIEPDDSGRPVLRRYVDAAIVMDDRTADGAYYNACFRQMHSYLDNLLLLEHAPEKINDDIL